MAKATLLLLEKECKVLTRFWSKVDFLSNRSCWLWREYRDKDGYGKFELNYRPVIAHRFAYEHLIGPIPKGLTIDHLCRNESCVNPSHMEIVSIRENVLRGDNPLAINARKTHCPRGHILKGDNLVKAQLKTGKRTCRICMNARAVIYQRKKRAKLAVMVRTL